MRTTLLVAIAFLLPAPAVANCAAGATPSYQDITYVNVRLYSLVGATHPRFEFKGRDLPPQGSFKGFAQSSLNARRAVPFAGSFVAVNPHQAFGAVVTVLEQNHFFDMRMTAPTCCIIDGPEDVVTAIRCGVTTTLSTASEGGTADLEDAQGRAFLQLENDLRATIFAQKWATPAPTPK
jgi:hypothetical protein